MIILQIRVYLKIKSNNFLKFQIHLNCMNNKYEDQIFTIAHMWREKAHME